MEEDKAKPALSVIEGGKKAAISEQRWTARSGSLRTNETPDRPSQPLTEEEVEDLRDGIGSNDPPPGRP